MKKRITALFFAVMLLMSTLAGCASGGKVSAEARKGVVRVIALKPNGHFSLGSAFAVGEAGKETDIFITNDHVIYDTYQNEAGQDVVLPALNVWILKSSAAVNPATGLDTSQAIPCEVLYASKAGFPDMAILKAAEPVPGRTALPLLEDESSLEVGDQVYALGYPGSSDETEEGIYGERTVAGVEDVTITSGVVSRFTTSATFGDTRIIQHDATVNHGNSGGPLINEHGAVVGINTYGMGQDIATGDVNSYYSVRIRYVMEQLDALGIRYDVYRPFPWWIVAVSVAAVVVIAAIIVVLIVRRKPLAVKNAAAPAMGAGTPASMPEYRIQGQDGAFAGRRFSVNGQVRIGRDPSGNDLVFPDNTPGISGRHCVVSLSGNQITLTDLGSSYGTFLAGGRRLAPNQPVTLRVGDCFFLGSDKQSFIVTGKGGRLS